MKLSGAKIALGVLGTFIAVVIMAAVMAFTSYVKYNDIAAAHEAGIKAANDASQVNLGQLGNKITEVVAVTGLAKDDLVETTKAAIQGRYGADGSKAVFQMIREVNPQVDPQLYLKVQQVIESGRESFERTQKVVIDRVSAYQVLRDSFWPGFWTKMAGWPRMDLSAIKPVTSDRAAEAFSTGRENPIQLRK